jgi:caffeoyl-CoA O-methyltransferase
LSGALVGGLLQILIRISGAKRILEVGTFTGYSALKMAEALPEDGTIDCCELVEKHIQTAKSWFNKTSLGDKISIHQGKAIDSMDKFKEGTFDIIFVDADKSNYPLYHKRGLMLLKVGGIGVFDNMLWSGTVLEPSDVESHALRETAELIKNNHRLEPLLMPIRDGVMVYRKNN